MHVCILISSYLAPLLYVYDVPDSICVANVSLHQSVEIRVIYADDILYAGDDGTVHLVNTETVDTALGCQNLLTLVQASSRLNTVQK